MTFTSDWFSHNIPHLTQTLSCVSHIPNILEIGSWEGRSTIWFLQHFPNSSIVCVDTWQGGVEHQSLISLPHIETNFLENTRNFQDRITILKGKSQEQLFTLQPESFDIIYVDGSHEAPDVLSDVILSFHLLKKNGILLLDDYANDTVISPDQYLHHAQSAINAFLDIYSQHINILHKDYQVHLQKL